MLGTLGGAATLVKREAEKHPKQKPQSPIAEALHRAPQDLMVEAECKGFFPMEPVVQW
jgi:hypothetical protein